MEITSVIDYEIVSRNPYGFAVNNLRVASNIALAALRDSGFYDHSKTPEAEVFHSENFDIGFVQGMEGIVRIRDFSGQPDVVRRTVEFQLKQLKNLRLETHPDCIERRDVTLYGDKK